jgi:hypothetical protein
MKKAYLMIGSWLILLFIPACKEPAPSQLSQRADSLLQEVDSLNHAIISANLDSIQDLYSKISSEHAFLLENFEKFPDVEIDEEQYVKLDSITLIVGFCLDACNQFYSEISAVENHLERIAEEIEEGEIPDSTISHQIEQESALLMDLTERVMLRMEMLQTQLSIYRDIQPDVECYVEQLSKKQPVD